MIITSASTMLADLVFRSMFSVIWGLDYIKLIILGFKMLNLEIIFQ